MPDEVKGYADKPPDGAKPMPDEVKGYTDKPPDGAKPMPDEVKGYADFMRGKYKHQPIVATDWPPRVGQDFFGRLALVEKKDNTQQEKSAWYHLRGQVDKIVKMPGHKDIRVKNILKPKNSSESLRVVIDGPPGIGKTTLCRKLLNMWSKGTLPQQYELALYCPLRNIKIATATTLTDLFVHQRYEVSVVAEWFRKRNGEGLLMIFDGWDELSTEHRQSSLVASIICSEELDQCSVIVTSRSYASSSLLNMTTVISRHVQVIGFSEDEISTVIIQTLQKDPKLARELIAENKTDEGRYKRHFTTIQSSKDSQLAVKLINHLKVRGDVQSLCYIPLVCSMVILVCHKEKGHLPTTLTQLYENFILQTIRRHIKKHNANPCTLGSLSSLPSQLVKPFQEMCQIAYTNLTNTRMTFFLHELSLSEAVKEDYLGLMTAFTEYDEEKYQFLHLSIQEFLAAWWIAKHEEKTGEVFETHFENDHFRMCLRFVAGLTHLEHESYQQYFNKQQLDLQCKRKPLFGFKVCHVSLFHLNPDVTTEHYQDSLSDDDFDKFPFLLQLLYESQNTALCQVLSQSINNYSLCTVETYFLFDWLCLSYFINNSNTTWKVIDLDVPYSNGKQVLSVFTAGLTNSSKQIQCERLILDVSNTSDASIKQLMQLSLLHNIQECYCKLWKVQCVSDGLVLLQFLNLPKMKVLHLIIDSPVTNIPIVGGNELQKSIEQNSTIQEMKIVYEDKNSQITDIITFIMRGVTGNTTLTSLSLTAKKRYHEDDVAPPLPDGVIEQLLKDNKTLQALSLDIDDELLPSSLNIVEVNMPLTALEIAGHSKLMTSFLTPHISGLKGLILHEKYLSPYRIFLVFHPSLETLRLPLKTAEAIDFFNILQTNTTLKALKVKMKVKDAAIVIKMLGDALQNMLTMNKTLKYLEIHTKICNWTGFGRDMKLYKAPVLTILLPYLTKGIEDNSTLQQLHICISLPNAEAMKALFDIISQKKNLTELKVTFSLDESHWESNNEKKENSDEEKESNDEEKESSDEEKESSDEEKESSDEEKESSDEEKESSDEEKESSDEKKESSDEKKESSDEKKESNDEEKESSDKEKERRDKMKKRMDEMKKRRDEMEERMTILFYEEVLPAVTDMLQSHKTIKLLKLKCDDLSDRKPLQNESEIIQHFFEAIFVHPTLEYIEIDYVPLSPLGKMLDNRKKSLIDKHKQEQPHKPLPIVDV